MHCPSINDLPPPPPGKTGCPWTGESPQLPDKMPDGSAWPKISIVTPSYNQGEFIEETIRSVLLQGYPDLEYLIIDGGSTDQSAEIIKKYENSLAYWVSEKDRGQSHAINKGFSRATGSIYFYLNSDDILYPGVLRDVALKFSAQKPPGLLCCSGRFFGTAVNEVLGARKGETAHMPRAWTPPAQQKLTDWLTTYASLFQQSTFWDSRIHKAIGGFREDLDFCFDKEFFLRAIFEHGAYQPCPEIIAGGHRLHGDCKTATIPDVMARENEQIWQSYRAKQWCQKILDREARERRAYDLVMNVLKQASFVARLKDLAVSAWLWPAVLHSRTYWGALRRTLHLPRPGA